MALWAIIIKFPLNQNVPVPEMFHDSKSITFHSLFEIVKIVLNKKHKYIRLVHKQISLNYIFQVTSLTFFILNSLKFCWITQFYNLLWSEVVFKLFKLVLHKYPPIRMQS